MSASKIKIAKRLIYYSRLFPLPGHGLPRARGLAAAASGRRVSQICHVGSRRPRHRTGPVALVGGAHLL